MLVLDQISFEFDKEHERINMRETGNPLVSLSVEDVEELHGWLSLHLRRMQGYEAY